MAKAKQFSRFSADKQPSLFEPPLSAFDPWPPIHRTIEGFRLTLAEAWVEGYVGFDLEFDERERPSILGIASTQSCAALPWDSQLCLEVIDSGAQLVAHAGAGADSPVVKKATGRSVPLNRWEDSMLLHYLLGQDYAAQPGKKEDEDDKQAMGLMNLWAMSSYWLDIPNWKFCRGRECSGPCPRHDAFGYCAVDSWAGLNGFLSMKEGAAKIGLPWRCYRELMKLAVVCDEMERLGVWIDLDFINRLEMDFEKFKKGIFTTDMGFAPPFNPNAPAATIQYFEQRGVKLKSCQRNDISSALIKVCQKYGVDFIEEHDQIHIDTDDETPEIVDDLYGLYQWKFSGKGLKSWFDERYFDKHDRKYRGGLLIGAFIHPRFNPVGTSTGRLSSSRPNFQNIPLRGWAAMVRRAVIARLQDHCIIKADKKQLELRMCLYAAEGPQPDRDAFSWMVAQCPAFKRFTNPRQAAKSVAHAFDYLEGLTLKHPWELKTARTKSEIESGAIVVHKDWIFRDQIVCFTGSNLAKRLFGSASFENRKKALEIQEVYSGQFPWLRKWQRRLSEQIERDGYVRSASGRFMYLHGSLEDQMKIGAAVIGQGQSAEHMQDIMVRYWEERGEVWTIQVHDEAVVERPTSWTDRQCVEWTELMEQETWRFPGFKCPVDVKRGPNWGECKEV